MKLFASRDYLPADMPHVPLLNPFWGAAPEDTANPLNGRFAEYESVGPQLFRMTSLEEADAAVYPAAWRPQDDHALARRLAEVAAAAGKPMLVFSEHDSTAPVDVDNAVAFRCSIYKSRRQPREFAQPAWSEDVLERYRGGQLALRTKQALPVVSYCGYSSVGITSKRGALEFALGKNPRIHQAVSALGYDLIRSPGPRVRMQAIHVLSHSRRVRTNFVIREKGFWDHVQRATGRVRNAEIAQQWRRDFVDNMIDSDYVLCTRGFGNFSYRLYETLCSGRIPVFLDTDCLLPYENHVDWRAHSVWVEERDIVSIADRVASFHDGLSDAGFQDLQRSCRRLWEEWLAPAGFFRNFHRHFPEA